MTLFLLAFLFLYGGVHLHLFMRVRKAIPLDRIRLTGLVFILVTMFLAPLGVRVAERHGQEWLASMAAFAGYTWMGFIFLFFCLSLLLDLCLFVMSGGLRLLGRQPRQPLLSPLWKWLAPVAVSLALNLYGYMEASQIRTERIILRSPKISASVGRVRIVQISDVHVGQVVAEGRLREIMRVVQAASPDILVATGDLLDGQTDSLSGAIRILKACQPRWGKFAVTGNHEFYAGLPHSLAFLEEAGFSVLRGRGVDLGQGINLAGVDDDSVARAGLSVVVSEKRLLAGLPRSNWTILLKHKPVVDPEALGLFDLQLSGHTHKGQIFPFSLLTRLVFPYHAGYFDLGGGAGLYVSRGTGTWGPPVRLLAPPEITVIDVVHESPPGP